MPPPRSASSGLPVASPAAAAAAAAAASSPPRAAHAAAATASPAAAFLSSPLGSATPRSSPRLADKVKRHHSALAAAATNAALPQQQGANHSGRCSDSTPPRSTRPPHGHSHQAAAAGAQKQSPAVGVAAKNASSAVPLPHGPLVRAQSCGAAPGYHKQLLPSNRECGVDFITPRTAAMLLLAQQHQETAATAAANNKPAACLSDAASSLLGPLTPLEHSQLAEWGRAYDKVHVLDARFEYEYEGGHIRGAVNVTSHAQAEAILMGTANENDKSHAGPSAPHRSGSRVCVLIHCEFSKKRGPKCFAFLRQRDRALNLHRYPELNFPELYVIAGGYQAFFLQSIPASGVSTSPSLCSIGAGANDKASACASAVAHALCTPPEYVAMADKRYRKEYAIAWSRMKKSGAAAGANGTLVGGAGGFHSPKDNSGNGAAENGAGGSGSNGKSGGPPRSRQGRTRSFAEMDSSSNNSPASCGTHSVHSSPAFMARSLSAVAALCSPASAASPVLGLMGSPITPSYPRPNRGLSLSLDSSAAAGGSNGAALAASTAAPFATAVPAPRRTNSAFSFKRTSSAASLAAMSGLGIGVPPSNSPSPSPSPSSAAAGAGVGAGSAVPSFPSFFGSGSVQPCSSPILSYGWSTEGRSSTPSPFMPESPRFSHSHSRSSAPSPLGWNSPSLGGFGSGSGSGSGSGAAFGYASSARGTPLSMLSEDSPRSRSASVVPGTFAGSSAAATVGALPPPMLAVGASSGGFASPQGRRRARAASALDFASGALSHSQSRSPSSALHAMHLRSSPSLSMNGSSASTSSYAYTQTLSSRSSSSPSPAPFDCASSSAYCGGVASPDAHVRAHSVTGHMDSPPGLMPARTATVAAGASPSQKQEMEVGGESEVPAAAGSSAQKRARYARERGDRDRTAAPHTAVALVYPPSPPLAPAAAPGTLGAAAVTVSPSKPTVTTRLASAHAELAAATAACAMEQ